MTTITLREMKRKVIFLLGDVIVEPGSGDTDPLHGSQTSAEELLNGIEAALQAVCSKFPRPRTLTFVAGSQFPLPVDFIRPEAVWDSKTRLPLPLISLDSNISMYGEANFSGNAFSIYPASEGTQVLADPPEIWDSTVNQVENGGVISFLTKVDSVKLFYAALWPYPVLDDDVISAPAILNLPIQLFATHYCQMMNASKAGGIRQFNTKVDSGSPLDNPLLDLSKFFLSMYYNAMDQVPMQPSGVH